MKQKQLERYAPWALLVATLVVWEVVCRAFSVSDFIFPAPSTIWASLVEHRALIWGHAVRTFWVTMVGFGLSIVVGVLLGFAAWHRFRLTPDLAANTPGAGRRLARSIWWEAAVMLIVFWAVAEMTSTSPQGDG